MLDDGQIETTAEQLDKLYARLPKVIGRIRDDSNDPELLVGMRALLKLFREINELERTLLPPAELGQYKDINLMRLYEMAEQSGDEALLAELQAANAAFAEENEILAERVKGQSFRIDTMQRQAADEIMGDRKDLSPKKILRSIKEVDASFANMQASLSTLEEMAGSSEGKGLDEKLFEALSGLDDITPEMLRVTPTASTALGRVLRQFGFAYDYKDVAALRQLLLVVLRANRKMAQLSASVSDLSERAKAIHELAAKAEIYAGHEERQGPQYQEAVAEALRLQERLASYEEMADLDKEIAERRLTIRTLHEEIEVLNQQHKAAEDPLKDLEEKITDLEEKLGEETAKVDKEKTRADKAEEDLAEKKTELLEEKRRAAENNARMTMRMRLMKGGLLLEKTEHELAAARQSAKDAEEKLDKAVQEKQALEERFGTWIEGEEAREKERESLRKRANLKLSFGLAAMVVAGAAGYFAAGLVSAQIVSKLSYYVTVFSIPAAIGTLLGAISAFEHGEPIKRASIGLAVGLGFGLCAAVLSVPGLETVISRKYNSEKAAFIEEKNTYFQKEAAEVENGKSSPYFVRRDEQGEVHKVPLSEQYQGKVLTLDFRDAANPVQSVTEGLVPYKPLPKAAPAADQPRH